MDAKGLRAMPDAYGPNDLCVLCVCSTRKSVLARRLWRAFRNWVDGSVQVHFVLIWLTITREWNTYEQAAWIQLAWRKKAAQ